MVDERHYSYETFTQYRQRSLFYWFLEIIDNKKLLDVDILVAYNDFDRAKKQFIFLLRLAMFDNNNFKYVMDINYDLHGEDLVNTGIFTQYLRNISTSRKEQLKKQYPREEIKEVVEEIPRPKEKSKQTTRIEHITRAGKHYAIERDILTGKIIRWVK